MTRRWVVMILAGCGSLVGPDPARADSLWERRNPYFANMMWDTRARRVGDVLTIQLTEVTTFDGREDRNMRKDTRNNVNASLSGSTAAGENTSRSFSAAWNSLFGSNRELRGRSDYRSERTLTDRMAVQVIDVLPNGNLMIEGFRTRVVTGEERTIRVSGIVRPYDVGASNTVQSQFIANFTVEYMGRGPETSYTTNGWLGRVVNRVWPF